MPDMRQLQGLSLRWASMFGMPHLGARYTDSGYELTTCTCQMCMCRPATNAHHVVPRSVRKTFTLHTERGDFELRSPLFAVCGSGTTGCHNRFHGGASLRAQWVWDNHGELWWDGTILSQVEPHSPELYRYGHWEIADGKYTIIIPEDPCKRR